MTDTRTVLITGTTGKQGGAGGGWLEVSMRRMLAILPALFLAAMLAGNAVRPSAAPQQATPSRATLFVGARLITDGDKPPIEDSAFLIEGDKITTIVAETFDNLTYTITVAKQKTGDDYLFNFKLTGAPPKTRTREKDEKPDEIKRRAEEYEKTLKGLEARVEFEKILGQWVYVMPAKSLEPLLKERAQMVVQPRKPGDDKAGPQGMPPGMMMPGMPR